MWYVRSLIWNPNAKQIPNNKVEENESSTPNTDFHAEMQQSATSAHTDSFEEGSEAKESKDAGNYTRPKGKGGRKSGFSYLRKKSLVAIIESIHDNAHKDTQFPCVFRHPKTLRRIVMCPIA